MDKDLKDTQIEEQDETIIDDVVDEKLYSQKDMDGAVQTRVARLKAQHEKELEAAKAIAAEEALKEQQRLSKLTEDEKAKETAAAKDKELAETKAKLNKVLLEQDTVERLNAEGIPIEFKSFLMGADAESTNENVKAFKLEFDKAIQEEVDKRLVGKTPKIANGQKVVINPWDKDTFNLTKQGEILRQDPELAKRLKAQAK